MCPCGCGQRGPELQGPTAGQPAYLLLQPIIVLHDACHGDVSPLHVESDVTRGLLLKRTAIGVSVDQEPGIAYGKAARGGAGAPLKLMQAGAPLKLMQAP